MVTLQCSSNCLTRQIYRNASDRNWVTFVVLAQAFVAEHVSMASLTPCGQSYRRGRQQGKSDKAHSPVYSSSYHDGTPHLPDLITTISPSRETQVNSE